MAHGWGHHVAPMAWAHTEGGAPTGEGARSRGDGAPARPLADAVVLLVEDQALIAMELQYVLEQAGATVIGPVTTLASAREMAETGAFDVVLLDLDLGGLDAIGVADVLVERRIPFVFHTGHGQRSELEAAYTAEVCIKPSRPETLIAALANARRT